MASRRLVYLLVPISTDTLTMHSTFATVFLHLQGKQRQPCTSFAKLWGWQENLAASMAAKWRSIMCDYSLQNVRLRPERVGDKLVTRDFGTGTHGFAAADELQLAVCVMPGTELAFARDVACLTTNHRTAIFRQINKDKMRAHHDALEFPDGRTELLTLLSEGQEATVLQLPAQPTTAAEADAQKPSICV
jgi:hypothetical protein